MRDKEPLKRYSLDASCQGSSTRRIKPEPKRNTISYLVTLIAEEHEEEEEEEKEEEVRARLNVSLQ